MTVAAARRAGFAIAVKSHVGWMVHCPECKRNDFGFDYKGEATKAAQAHNAEFHKPDSDEAYAIACSVASALDVGAVA